MIITAGLLIGIASTYLEVKLVNSWAWLRKVYRDGFMGIPGVWVNNAMSFLLGAIIGAGAGGVIALMGGLFGLVLSNMYFSVSDKLNAAGINKSAVEARLDTAKQWGLDNKSHFQNLAKTLMLVVKIIGLPFMLLAKANSVAHASKDKINAAKVKYF